MVFRRRDAAYALAIIIAAAPCARAQSAAQAPADAQALRTAIDDLKKDFDQRLAPPEGRPAAAEAGSRNPPPAGAPQATTAPAVSPESATGASVTNAKVFNPDMAVIGDFLGAVGKPNIDPANGRTPDP